MGVDMPDDMPDLTKQHLMETYRSMITLGMGTLKTMSLLNGGAAIALLAFISHNWDKQAPDLSCSMTAFVGGLTACGFATVTGYLTQLALYNEEQLPRQPRSWWKRHKTWLWLSIGSVVLSLVAFVTGAITGVNTFG